MWMTAVLIGSKFIGTIKSQASIFINTVVHLFVEYLWNICGLSSNIKQQTVEVHPSELVQCGAQYERQLSWTDQSLIPKSTQIFLIALFNVCKNSNQLVYTWMFCEHLFVYHHLKHGPLSSYEVILRRSISVPKMEYIDNNLFWPTSSPQAVCTITAAVDDFGAGGPLKPCSRHVKYLFVISLCVQNYPLPCPKRFHHEWLILFLSKSHHLTS